jgi:hypothetical protein
MPPGMALKGLVSRSCRRSGSNTLQEAPTYKFPDMDSGYAAVIEIPHPLGGGFFVLTTTHATPHSGW